MLEEYKDILFAGVLCLCMVVSLMTLYKNIWWAVTKKDTCKLTNQIVAWIFSYCSVVLSWAVLNVPERFSQTFIYVFAVYVLQMIIDLKMIKKISDAFWNKKLGIKGCSE